MQICWHMIHCISVSFCKKNDTKLDLNTLKWQPFSSSFFACHLIFPLIFFLFRLISEYFFYSKITAQQHQAERYIAFANSFHSFFLSMFFLSFFASSTLVISIFFHLYFAMCCFFLFLFRLKLLFFSALYVMRCAIVFVFFLFGSVFFHLCIYFHFFFFRLYIPWIIFMKVSFIFYIILLSIRCAYLLWRVAYI